MILKKCSRCKQFLPLVAFGKNRQQKDGLECRCRFCRSYSKSIINSKGNITKSNSYSSNRYWLHKMFNPSYNYEHYIEHRDYYIAKRARIQQGLQWHKKYINPFIDSTEIEWHHINNIEVVAVPKDLHRLYCTNNRKEHRENMRHIVKQIYKEEIKKC